MHFFEYLEGIAGVLNYHRSSGIESYPRNDGVDRFLIGVDSRQHPGTIPRSHGDALKADGSRMTATAKRKGDRDEGNASPESFETIGSEIAGCRACSLHDQRIGCRAGNGHKSGVRLMLVGDWLRSPDELSLPGNVQFGVEEDLMVSRMLEAIHLEKDKVCVANTIKCVVPVGCEPTPLDIVKCESYLHRQIALIEPEIICGMGLVAAKALLGSLQPLSRLRGGFHSFTVGEGKRIPVVVTYHPTFLLQNPAMKKAAWTDLQRIGKYLKTY